LSSASRPNTSCVGVARVVVCSLPDCAQDSGPAEVFVEIILVLYVLDTDHVAYDLLYPFDDGIRLPIPGGNPFDSDPVFILESCLHFGFELSSLIALRYKLVGLQAFQL
jgi:hypothetical protein